MSRAWNLTMILSLLFIALAIPLGDVYLGSLQLEKRCKADAGLQVYKTVEVDGFYSDKLFSNYTLKYGYLYIEGYDHAKYYRFIRADGKTKKEIINRPKSLYIYTAERKVLNKAFSKSRYLIKNRNTDELLGERINYAYHGGWLDRYIFLSWIDYKPITCGLPHYQYHEFLLSTLVPS